MLICHSKHHQVRSIVVALLFIIILISCARVGSPTGGPKDEKPPVSISAEPDFGSTNFKGHKIKINFNEYIKFKDLNKQLIVSPPLKYQPEVTPLGIASKSITIKIKDTLRPHTTYTFNFGNSIVDNAEGNVLKQFKYVFSTGDYIDSLEIKGNILNIMSDELPKNTTVMLYALDSTYNDSVIYKTKPNYVGNTLDSTLFSITNIKEGNYKIFALKDANANMVYDPRVDQIAFQNDTVKIPSEDTYELTLFKEEPSFEIKRLSEHSKNRLWIPYEGQWKAEIVELEDANKTKIPFVAYQSQEYDSIDVWYKDISTDSMFVNIKTDSLKTYSIKLRKKDRDSLMLKSNISRILHPNDSLFIEANIPLVSIDKELMSIMDKDSTKISFEMSKDKNPLRVFLDFKRQPENNYIISVLPGAVKDFFDQTNDSIQLGLKTQKLEDYGEIVLEVITDKNIIVELLDDKNNSINTRHIERNSELTYSKLIPGKYKFKFVIDENNNKLWDTGSFLNNRQPERIIYYNKIIELRANWTTNESINISN